MKPRTKIVENGGWVSRRTVGRPRARLFGFLSILWLGVSLCASFPFWKGWPESFGYVEWVCGALLVAHAVLVTLAIRFLLTEQPRAFVEQHHSPRSNTRELRSERA